MLASEPNKGENFRLFYRRSHYFLEGDEFLAVSLDYLGNSLLLLASEVSEAHRLSTSAIRPPPLLEQYFDGVCRLVVLLDRA